MAQRDRAPGAAECCEVSHLDGRPLEDLDAVAGPELDDGLLPARLPPACPAAALGLRLHLHDVHGHDLDVEEILDGLPDLRLVRARVHAEGVLVVLDQAVALLGDDRGEDDLARIEAHLDATSCTRSRAPSVASSERAQTIAPTSSSDGSTTRARSRLRKLLTSVSSSGSATTRSGDSAPQACRSSAAAFVEGSSNAPPGMTAREPRAAWWESAERSAARRALRLTFRSKLRGTWAKATPPPVHWGARVEPARARPVPFCRHGFDRPPETRARVFAARVPARAAAVSALTTSCTRCGFTSTAKTASASETSFDFLPDWSSTGALGAATSGCPPGSRPSSCGGRGRHP